VEDAVDDVEEEEFDLLCRIELGMIEEGAEE